MASKKVAKKEAKKDPQARKKGKPTTINAAVAKKEVAPVITPQAAEPIPLFAVSQTAPSAKNKEREKKLAALRTTLGDQLVSADQLSNVYMLRRPTGIISLDIALGGGFPAGGACMISGPYNSGKSWLLFRSMAMQQQLYGNDFMGALHVAETQVPYDQMLQAGMKVCVPDKVIKQYIQRDMELGLPMWTSDRITAMKQQVGHLEIISGGTGEQVLNTVLECNKQGIFNIIGVDSVSSLEPQRDSDKTMDDEAARAARAIMMGKFWTKYVPFVNKGDNTTTLLFTQQVRQNDTQYGRDWTITGGEATKHYKLIDLGMWSGKQAKRTIHGVDYVVGKKVLFETIKGKAGTHDHVKGEFDFYYSEFFPGNVDVHGDLILHAIQQNLLVPTSHGVQLVSAVSREPLAGMTAPDERSLKECIAVDFDFELEFRRHILAAAGIKCLYRFR